METTIKIINVQRKPTTGFVFDVTYVMNFELDGETDRKIGNIRFTNEEISDTFISFDELTEAIVLGWVTDSLGAEKIAEIKTEFKARLEERIEKKKNPTSLTGMPWVKKSK